MTAKRQGGPRGGLVLPSLLVVAILLALVGLGSWQVQRKAWKEALIGTLERNLSASPVELAAREHWASLVPEDHDFKRVRFTAEFVPAGEALIYAGVSALRSDVSGPGYWVFAPARVSSGGLVIVNRGFVPESRQDPSTRAAGETVGVIELVGVMRWPQPPGFFTPADNPARNLWFVRDPVAIAAAKGWGEVAPFYIELESPQPNGGLPRPGALRVNLRNEHLHYALTWYGLAVALAVMYMFWLRGRRAA